MSRTLIFAKRNLKEIMLSPVTIGFGIMMPLAILVIMQIIVKAIGANADLTPMFKIDKFICGSLIFAASFLSMIMSMIISQDRGQSFLARLYSSPMKAREYIFGYALSIVPLAAVQILALFLAALCFGLVPSWNILLASLFSVLIALFFIAIGVLLGSFMSEKSAPPVCSAVVQMAALLSGMWFDLKMIGGGFEIFCKILPFANCYDLIDLTLSGDFGEIWRPLVVVLAYLVVFSVLAIFAFKKKSTSSN